MNAEGKIFLQDTEATLPELVTKLQAVSDNKPDRRIFVGTIRDITDRKRHEERIREQASLLEKVHEGIVVRDLDDRIRFWNRGAEALFGWHADEALGRPAVDFLHGVGVDDLETIPE